jgi:2-polyprenyl-3-methyl-5-hydroxy-6-metoxy-1,4-benzoquinol methylase
MVYADVDSATYASLRHNVWDEVGPSPAADAFYLDARAKVHERFLAEVGPPDGRRLLDVGCGLGAFLMRAQEAGWDIYGCDTSSAWVERARKVTSKERIHLGEVTPELHGGQRYELVTAWDVIEHVHEPLEFLRSVRQLLAPGGRLFLRTPNFDYVWPVYGLRRHILREDVRLGPLHHVVYFSSRTLRAARSATGFAAERWPVLVPPQVPLGNPPPDESARVAGGAAIRLKNVWAGLADRVSATTGGRVTIGSDLDVIAAPRP